MSLPEEIVAGTADALIAVDTAGVIEHWNPAAERLLGFPEAAALGRTLAILFPPPARRLHIEGFHRAMETGRLDTGGAPVRVNATHAAGHTVDLEMTLGLRAQQGRLVGAVASLRPAGPRPPITDYAATGE